ncbi:MAG: helix-turn-helix domain-containing protein [candidate division WOR-3 bacterium]|nr:helix-turn-helix domain-containing protein [candidate division WOR-3 bacterium]
MPEEIFIFTKEMAELLKKMRLRAHLSQQQVAVRLGLSPKSGKKYISSLERGEIRNPTIGTVLRYLKVCGVSWSEFFSDLSAIDSGMRMEKPLSGSELKLKLSYDITKYTPALKHFPYHKYKYVDLIRLKKTIDDKILELLEKSKVEKELIPYYMLFADEFFSSLEEKLLRAELKPSILLNIKRTVQKILNAERKRIMTKPLSKGKREQMAIGFTETQVAIEPILNDVRKQLNEIAPDITWIMLYEDFAQEICLALNKYNKNDELLENELNEIIKRWVKRGLKEIDLQKVKDATIKAFNIAKS